MILISTPPGLSSAQAKELLQRNGFNELKEKHRTTAADVLKRQFKSFIIYVLAAAAIISLAINEAISFYTITAIIAFVISLGFFQEYRAEKAMAALKQIVQPKSRAYRDGKLVELPSRELVEGDLLSLEDGDRVPADAEIVEMTGLRVNESMLTGESEPVEKNKGDGIYAGTQIVFGRCKAKITATGMNTRLGKIAGTIQTSEDETPLQIKINHMSKRLATLALIVCAATFVLGIIKGAPPLEILLIALALAVAAVPEGLALTLTLTLAYGMKRMAEKNAIMRKMLAVETLGSVTVIATDKTGTLTKNEMTVEKVYANGKEYAVTGTGYAPKGAILFNGKTIAKNELELLARASSLCNNAVLNQEQDKWNALGDPTEAALLVMAAKAGQWKEDEEEKLPRIEEIVFTSERKLMTCIHSAKPGLIAFTKGAIESVLPKCTSVLIDGKKVALDKEQKEKIIAANQRFSEQAYRALAIAYNEPKNAKEAEKELVFLGLVAMRDPPREEVPQAIATCKQAGIKVVMITGDNHETAKAIAKSIGLFEPAPASFKNLKSAKLREIVEDGTITGAELETLSDEEFDEVVEGINIYARVMPEQKLRIVNAFKKKGHVIAMTGDGVNDAPALKRADIGIAMGLKGTDVAKEASSMVLQDDNFATIVDAIRRGRTIYSNIEKFTTYLISRNFTEVILILLGILLLGFASLPLIALQILFINTFDEIVPSISIGLEHSREETMKKKPRKTEEQLLKKRNLALIVSTAAFIALSVFAIFLYSNPLQELEKARTLTFAAIISTILFIPFCYRSLDQSIRTTGVTSNRLMLLGAISTFAITAIAMYVPIFQHVFELVPLSATDWLLPLATGFAAMVFIEIMKQLTKRLETRAGA